MITKHTISANIDLLSGTPANGTARIEAVGDNGSGQTVVIPAIRDTVGNTIFVSPQTVKLVQGVLLGPDGAPAQLPATDAAGASPGSWSYRITLQLDALTKAQYPVFVFELLEDVDLADVVMVPPASLAADAPWSAAADRAEAAADRAEAYGGSPSNIGIDTDGVPYFDPAGVPGSTTTVLADTDGVPYFTGG